MTLQEVLRNWKEAHSAITDLLLEKDTVTGSEIEKIMATHPAVPVQDSAANQVRTTPMLTAKSPSQITLFGRMLVSGIPLPVS